MKDPINTSDLRVTPVADAPENYQHVENLPEIAPNDDFDGLRVAVVQLPLPTRIAMTKLGGDIDEK